MNSFARILLYALLIGTQCQCQCVRACWSFLRGHASTGRDTRFSTDLPPHAITFQEFASAPKNVGVPLETLHTRFNVADGNGDGVLTPEEIVERRRAVQQRMEEGRRNPGPL